MILPLGWMEVRACRLAARCVFWRAHVSVLPGCLISWRKQALTFAGRNHGLGGQTSSLHSTRMTFFSYQRKSSNLVTSEMLCIGRKSQEALLAQAGNWTH